MYLIVFWFYNVEWWYVDGESVLILGILLFFVFLHLFSVISTALQIGINNIKNVSRKFQSTTLPWSFHCYLINNHPKTTMGHLYPHDSYQCTNQPWSWNLACMHKRVEIAFWYGLNLVRSIGQYCLSWYCNCREHCRKTLPSV